MSIFAINIVHEISLEYSKDSENRVIYIVLYSNLKIWHWPLLHDTSCMKSFYWKTCPRVFWARPYLVIIEFIPFGCSSLYINILGSFVWGDYSFTFVSVTKSHSNYWKQVPLKNELLIIILNTPSLDLIHIFPFN